MAVDNFPYFARWGVYYSLSCSLVQINRVAGFLRHVGTADQSRADQI